MSFSTTFNPAVRCISTSKSPLCTDEYRFGKLCVTSPIAGTGMTTDCLRLEDGTADCDIIKWDATAIPPAWVVSPLASTQCTQAFDAYIVVAPSAGCPNEFATLDAAAAAGRNNICVVDSTTNGAVNFTGDSVVYVRADAVLTLTGSIETVGDFHLTGPGSVVLGASIQIGPSTGICRCNPREISGGVFTATFAATRSFLYDTVINSALIISATGSSENLHVSNVQCAANVNFSVTNTDLLMNNVSRTLGSTFDVTTTGNEVFMNNVTDCNWVHVINNIDEQFWITNCDFTNAIINCTSRLEGRINNCHFDGAGIACDINITGVGTIQNLIITGCEFGIGSTTALHLTNDEIPGLITGNTVTYIGGNLFGNNVLIDGLGRYLNFAFEGNTGFTGSTVSFDFVPTAGQAHANIRVSQNSFFTLNVDVSANLGASFSRSHFCNNQGTGALTIVCADMNDCQICGNNLLGIMNISASRLERVTVSGNNNIGGGTVTSVVENTGTLRMTDFILSNNNFTNYNFELKSNLFEQCHIQDNTFNSFQLLHLGGGTINALNCMIDGNVFLQNIIVPPGVLADFYTGVELVATTISNNVSKGQVRIDAPIISCAINGNVMEEGDLNNPSFIFSANAPIEKSVISANTIGNNLQFFGTITSSNINNNHIEVGDMDFNGVVTDCTISNNSLYVPQGGSQDISFIIPGGAGPPNPVNCVISGNRADRIFADNFNARPVANTVVAGNRVDGPGLFFWNVGELGFNIQL